MTAMSALALAFAWLAPGASALAQADAHGHHAAQPARAALEMGISAAFDAQQRLWAASKELDEQSRPILVLRHSSDAGKTWSPPQTVVQDAVTARGEERPQLAFGPKGELLILYTSPLAGSKNPHVGSIRLVRSQDGGKSFSEPITVHANREPIVHAFGNLVLDRDGRIYVVWIDGRDSVRTRAAQEKYAGSALYYAVSSDGGASFQGDYKIADHSCECCRIGLNLNGQGRPVALWRHVFEGNIRDHAISELAANGKASAIQRASFDDWRIEACPHHGPSLAYADDGVRHQVWFNGKEGPGGGALYASAGVDGKLGKPTVLGTAQASHPDVAVQGSNVAVVWKQFNGKNTAIVLRSSADGGQNWTERELATTLGDSDRPRLIKTPQGLALLWHTRDEGLRMLPVAGGQS